MEHLSYRKKLIEAALPLDDINRESAREKSIRCGYSSTLLEYYRSSVQRPSRVLIRASANG